MIAIGALLAGTAVLAAVLGAGPRSVVAARVSQLAPRPASAAWLQRMLLSPLVARAHIAGGVALLRTKILVAVVFAAVAAAVSVLFPIGPALVAVAAYVGFVLPSVQLERALARRREDAERAMVTLLEWTEALVASGQPIETAFAAVAARGVGAPLLDQVLEAGARSYALGAPLFASLAHEAAAAGLTPLADLAGELDRARGIGRGALTVVRDERDRLRAAERARSLDEAGRVEGRLTLILVLCYMPALMLLVVIPLFLGLLAGLFV